MTQTFNYAGISYYFYSLMNSLIQPNVGLTMSKCQSSECLSWTLHRTETLSEYSNPVCQHTYIQKVKFCPSKYSSIHAHAMINVTDLLSTRLFSKLKAGWVPLAAAAEDEKQQTSTVSSRATSYAQT